MDVHVDLVQCNEPELSNYFLGAAGLYLQVRLSIVKYSQVEVSIIHFTSCRSVHLVFINKLRAKV